MSQGAGCRQLRRTESVSNSYLEIAAPGVVVEDLLTSSYWSAVVRGMRSNDLVTVIAADGSFEVEIRIMSVSTSGIMGLRLLREWRPPLSEQSAALAMCRPGEPGLRSHYLVARNPVAKSLDWVCARRNAGESSWTTIISAIKPVCAREAVEALKTSMLSADLTITTVSPTIAFGDPDLVPSGYDAMILVPERKGEAHRWQTVNVKADGRCRAGSVVVGKNVQDLLDGIAAEAIDNKFDTSVFMVRPGLNAEELLADGFQNMVKRKAA